MKITNSKNLRKQFNEYFPTACVKHARISAGGSYVLEFENEKDADEVDKSWKKEYFSGNSGVVKPGEESTIGIVKYVYLDLDEDEIKEEIQQNYPGCEFDLFMKNGEFIGIIKVKFKSAQELKQAITNRFKISNRLYVVVPFEPKPRVIKCNTCQRFGHVSRLCRSKQNPICGKCSSAGHETKDCTKSEEEFKCFHCGNNDHITGSYACQKVQEKYQDLIVRRQNVL